MKKREISEIVCSIARAVAQIGDTWKLLILKELFLHNLRFDSIAQQTGMSPHSLSTRLAELESDGIVERWAYQQNPVRYEYRLTEKGIDLWPMMVALNEWGDRWILPENERPMMIHHKGCGPSSKPQVACRECGEPMEARDAIAQMAPHASRYRSTR